MVDRATATEDALRIRNESQRSANTPRRLGDMFLTLVSASVFGSIYDITVLGALPSISTPAQGIINTQAIQAAANAANAAGGGKVYIPPGDWYFAAGTLDPNVVCQLNNLSRITFEGGGPGVTRLHLLSGANSNFFNMDGTASYITIRDMELDGNRLQQNQTLGVSGIRSSNISGLWLSNLYIHDIVHYGIGLEGYVQQYLFFDNIKLENLGGDGFDQKNKADANVHQHASNITVKNFGLNTAEVTQAGWDCRGAWQLSNYTCHFSASDGSGVRFRNGEAAEPDVGLGGHRSHFTNFEIYGPGSGSTSTGLEIVARDVAVTNGYVCDVFNGVGPTFSAQRSSATNVTVERANSGFLASIGSDGFSFTNCTAISASNGFRIRAPHVSITSCEAHGYSSNGITTEQSGSFLNVVNPFLSGTAALSVGVSITTPDCTVIGGTATGNFRGFTTQAPRSKFISARSVRSTDDGFVIAPGGDDCIIANCTISGNLDKGITLRALRARVSNNDIVNNGSVGIDIINTATGSVLFGNNVSGNLLPISDVGSGTIGTYAVSGSTGYIAMLDALGIARRVAVF